MKKVGIMQPYIFSYIGYWQLIHAVDIFVVLDDVNFITRGYINRNSILVNGMEYKFSIPVRKCSQDKLICESELCFTKQEREKFLKMIFMAYKKAPEFEKVYPVLEMIINHDTQDVTEFIIYSIQKICEYLFIETEICRSVELKKNNKLRAQERILEICRVLGADTYINPCGGYELYSQERFQREHMDLYFLSPKMSEITYQQFANSFIPNLSIIDMLMFNSVEKIKFFLEKYELIK